MYHIMPEPEKFSTDQLLPSSEVAIFPAKVEATSLPPMTVIADGAPAASRGRP